MLWLFLFVGISHAKMPHDTQSRTEADSVRIPKLVEKPKPRFKDTSIYTRRMASSAFPVQMQVKGVSLLIISDYSQLLPIYTRGGTFYMAMRLNKGKNWLNGLPRGCYIINNRNISIP